MNSRPFLIIAVIVATACGEVETSESAEEFRSVRTIVLTNDDTLRERTFSGLIQSSLASRLSFKLSGTVVDVPVQVGARLKAGDVIARLDSSTVELELEQSRAKLVQAEATQRNAESNYERIKGLYENSNASKNDLDVARASAETSKAEMRSARKSVEITSLNKSYTTLRASSSCVVTAIAIEENENVSTGQEVATVNCGDGLEVQFGVPEGLIGDLENGATAKIVPNIANGISYSGTITEIGIGGTSSAATYPVTARIDNPDSQIRPNMAAQVSFAIPESEGNPFHVPASAVAQDAEGTFVFLAQPSEPGRAIVNRRSVEIGELTSKGLEVSSGLNNGDHVVTAGLSFLRAEQIVLLPNGS